MSDNAECIPDSATKAVPSFYVQERWIVFCQKIGDMPARQKVVKYTDALFQGLLKNKNSDKDLKRLLEGIEKKEDLQSPAMTSALQSIKKNMQLNVEASSDYLSAGQKGGVE